MERTEPELERMARRARRVLWAFRLLFYGGAAIAAVLLLTGRSSGYSATWLDGRTDQDRQFTMRLDDTGPRFVKTTLIGRCQDGREWETWWSVTNRPQTPFLIDGHSLKLTDRPVREYDDGWTGRLTVRLTAHVDDDEVTGTMSFVERLTHPGAPDPYVCESDTVAFSAPAG